MDRDRQAVTDIDAMRRRRLRITAMLACAGLTVVVLWAARVPQVLFVGKETKQLSLDGAVLAKPPTQSAALQPDFPSAPLP